MVIRCERPPLRRGYSSIHTCGPTKGTDKLEVMTGIEPATCQVINELLSPSELLDISKELPTW